MLLQATNDKLESTSTNNEMILMVLLYLPYLFGIRGLIIVQLLETFFLNKEGVRGRPLRRYHAMGGAIFQTG